MFEGVVNGTDRLPDEFDEVTSQIKYPEITKDTTEKEFLKHAENGYKKWVVIGGVAILGGCGLFMWGMWEILKWL